MLRRFTASMTAAALILGIAAAPAIAKNGSDDDRGRSGIRLSGKFEDMIDFEWGLSEVIKMSAKGVFKGRGDRVFAPGAKITRQEAAVAIVRLMDKETVAQAATEAEVEAALNDMPDQAQIAAWARSSVAFMVKQGMLEETESFRPLEDATRLDIAVMLAKAMGFEAEAQAKMETELSFKDAQRIPAELVGYVAVAVDHKLITGYDDRTFRPEQAVKRIEMAVMMGRADRLFDREREDEYKGVIKSVNVAGNAFVITVGQRDIALQLAAEASIFINSTEKSLADLVAGMHAEVKLNQDGKVIFVEGRPVTAPQDITVQGSITSLTAATGTSLALVGINGTAYPLSPTAVLKLGTQTAAFADLRAGDTVKAIVRLGLVIRLEATRPSTTVTGTITGMTPAAASAPAKMVVAVTTNNVTTNTEYTLAANSMLKLNGQTAQFADLRIGDSVMITLASGVVDKVEATRLAVTVNGTLSGVTAATTSAPARLTVAVTANNVTTDTQYTLAANAAIKVNGLTSQLADLRIGDTVTLTVGSGLVDKVEVNRVAETVIEGSLVSINAVAVNAVTPGSVRGVVSLGYNENGTFTMRTFTVTSTTQITVNSQVSQFADLRLGDQAKLHLLADMLVKVEVLR